MKNLYIIIVLSLILSCSTSPVEKGGISINTYSNFIKLFFDRYVEDLHRAESVVHQRDLIKNLSHLQKMNAGGKRYYLLERESITELLQSITIEKYRDIILTGPGGRVLYTMHEDSLFNTIISRNDDHSALYQCYKNSIQGNTYIHPPSEYPGLSSRVLMFISYPVKTGGELSGLLIAAIDPALLVSEKPGNVMVLDSSGKIALTTISEELGKPVIPEKLIEDHGKSPTQLRKRYGRNNYRLQPVQYLNIRWFITETN